MSEAKPLNESRNTVQASQVILANSRNTVQAHSGGELAASTRRTVAVHPTHSGAGPKGTGGGKSSK